ncbi:MAG: 50S ribosomal protein L4 [Candidatus Aenigmarchaeota archaeon ex4484_56]|nr:MAG: 50S ribosomal protein L4 [Candidatus Aenigmarchaeota archaeon ex4484_56]
MANIYSIDGTKKGTINLDKLLNYKIREDLIKKTVIVFQANKRKKYGADKLAGMRSSAHYHGSSHVYPRARMAGVERARLPRIHGEGPLLFVARIAPHVVKGRKAHPPKPEKDWSKNINRKENKVALISAIAASLNKEIVNKRGHKMEKVKDYPIIFEDNIENLEKTKEIFEVLKKFGLEDELNRSKQKKVRAGKGKLRGRKYKRKKGPIIIVSKKCKLQKAARNIPGIDVSIVSQLNVEKLAPGTHIGRLSVWTESSINYFLDKIKI